MSLFDFLKPKKTESYDALLKHINENPQLMCLTLKMQFEKAKAQAENLVAVGRKPEALDVCAKYLESATNVWMRDSNYMQNTEIINHITHTVITMGTICSDANKTILNLGKDLYLSIIEGNQKDPFMDLTQVYYCLGLVYHQIGNEAENELWAYHCSTEASAPEKCKTPASKFDKIRSHHFASMCAYRISNKEHEEWHNYKKRFLAPEVNWDDDIASTKWLLGVK